MSEEGKKESLNDELKREIKKGAKLEHAPEAKRQEIDLSAEKALLEKLRAEGYAVTEISARGRDGMVTLMDITVKRKEIDGIDDIVRSVDDQAFITLEEMRPLRRGYWRK